MLWIHGNVQLIVWDIQLLLLQTQNHLRISTFVSLRVPFPSFPCEGSNFMFDSCMFLDPEKYNDICQYASEQCRAAGFKIYKHNLSKRGSHGSRLSTLVLACEHNREPVQLPKKNKKHYRTCRPVDGTDRCPFQIKIVCNKKDGCWYLLSHNPDEICESYHKGHIHLPPSTVQTNLSELNEDELQRSYCA